MKTSRTVADTFCSLAKSDYARGREGGGVKMDIVWTNVGIRV